MTRGRKKKVSAGGLTVRQRFELKQSEREADIKVALIKLGVRRSRIMEIVEHYDLTRIERQLRWLPYRRARKPSSLIVSAIKEDYEEPAAALEPQPSNNSSSDLELESQALPRND